MTDTIDAIADIDQMIRLRSSRVPSISQMRAWKAEIELLRAALRKIERLSYFGSTASDIARAALPSEQQPDPKRCPVCGCYPCIHVRGPCEQSTPEKSNG